jgi:RNA polymerase sigma-32 factor
MLMRGRINPSEAFERDKDLTRDQLVIQYTGLARRIAANFAKWGPYDELVSEGYVGLCIAADKYDRGFGRAFSTYATWWVRAKIMLFISQNQGVRLGRTNEQRKVFFGIGRVTRALGEAASEEAIAERLGVEVRHVHDHQNFGRLASFDELDPEGRWLPDAGTESPEDFAAEREAEARNREVVAELEDRLSERERLILRERHLAAEPKTLTEIGALLGGISRQRVQQLEDTMMEKMKRWAKLQIVKR